MSALAATPAPLLFEEITNTGCADPREDLHELRRGDAEEGHTGLALYPRYRCPKQWVYTWEFQADKVEYIYRYNIYIYYIYVYYNTWKTIYNYSEVGMVTRWFQWNLSP